MLPTNKSNSLYLSEINDNITEKIKYLIDLIVTNRIRKNQFNKIKLIEFGVGGGD